MVLLLQLWEIKQDDGTVKRGNWIGAVSPRQAGAAKPAAAKPEPVKTVEEKIDEAFDDDIGF